MPLRKIVVGDRHRRNMGDITSLAASINDDCHGDEAPPAMEAAQ
jgi:hypothetical protein